MAGGRLFLAPHLDDGAISFGGTLLADHDKQSAEIQAVVATVFSRSNYTSDGLGDVAVVTPIRQAEERAVMGSIGVGTLFLGFPECPLRGYTISDPLDYPKRIRPELDAGLVEKIAARFRPLFRNFREVLAPVALGDRGHVDHRLVRLAAPVAWKNTPGTIFRLYEDTPYIGKANRDRVSALEGVHLEETVIDLRVKVELVRGYGSQPIESWEGLIREAAGHPPTERTWAISGPDVLERLE